MIIIRFSLPGSLQSARRLRARTVTTAHRRRRKLFPLYMDFGLTLGASSSPGAAYCVTGEIIVRGVLGNGSTRATKSTPIRSAVFRRGTVLYGKFSKPGENVREKGKERKRERESFADSLKLLLSTPLASPAEATAPSCN